VRDAIAAPVASRTTSARTLPTPNRRANGAHRVAGVVPADRGDDGGDEHQLPADEEREREHVQEPDDGPAVHHAARRGAS
jgi:hypothetical protein